MLVLLLGTGKTQPRLELALPGTMLKLELASVALRLQLSAAAQA